MGNSGVYSVFHPGQDGIARDRGGGSVIQLKAVVVHA